MAQADIKKKILVIDDDSGIRNTLIEILEAEGFKAYGAIHGEDALEKLNETNIPNLIILDVSMPIMGGEEFFKIIKSNEFFKDIPVIFHTADKFFKNKVGASGILYKPTSYEAIETLIEEYFA